MNSCCEGQACALCRGYTKELAREGLMLSVNTNTKSLTIYCLLPLTYKEQMKQPHGRDSWALKTEQRTMFHTEKSQRRGVEVWQHSVCLVAFCQHSAIPEQWGLLSGERQEALSVTPGGHSAQWLRADPLSHPSRPARLVGTPLGPAFRNWNERGKSRIY